MPAKQPCRINGVLYHSQREAAIALGMTEGAITAMLRRGQFYTKAYRDKHGFPTRHQVVVRGKSYRSRVEAAKALGVSRLTIYRWLKKEGLEDPGEES